MKNRFFPALALILIPISLLIAQPGKDDIIKAKEFFNEGIQSGLQGEYKKALKKFNSATELNPLFAEAFLYKGLACAELSDHIQAIKNFNITIELDSRYSDQAFYFRAVSRAATNDHPGAILDFTRAININPDHISFLQRGKSNFALQQYGRALQDFEIALRISPGFREAVLYRGMALYHTGLISESLDDLNKAIGFFPNSAVAFFYRGMVYRSLQNEVAAQENLQRAMAIDPEIEKQLNEYFKDSTPAELSDAASPVIAIPRQLIEQGMETGSQEQTPEMPEGLQSGYYDHNLTLLNDFGGYGVQVASYSNADKIVNLANSYAERYQHPVFIKITSAQERTLFRIIIGSLDKRQQAEALRDNLRQMDFPDCFIVDLNQVR